MQGYHFSRPLPAPDIGEYLTRFNSAGTATGPEDDSKA
jgi:EAL domain-containing protein (putative c-di-GMP-specific phosphodiesterase class I)